MQKALIKEPADLSWARALVLATGIFFLSVIYMGQIPGYFELVSTQSNLSTLSQSLLTFGLLNVGFALIGLTASFLFDPKPVAGIFVGLFGLLGLALAGAGTTMMLFVLTGVWHKYLPDQQITITPDKQLITTNWPDPSKGYLFHPAWFQPGSIDLAATGFVILFIGLGIIGYVGLYPLYRSGLLDGPFRNLLTQLSVGIAGALLLAYMTLYTFSPENSVKAPPASGALQNSLLALALFLVMFAMQTWLLPVMTAPGNRQRFMPANYLHAVMLIGNVAGPLLTIFFVLYPLVNFLATHLPTDNWFIQCGSARNIPGSCTFTSNMGYVVAGVVGGMFFSFFIAAGYLWNRKPAFTRLGTVYAFLFAASAVVVAHTVSPTTTQLSLALAIGIAIMGLVWTISTQREFVPAAVDARPLGCVGQWLVMGTLLLIYLAGFAFFSFPEFLDTEPNLPIISGTHTIHDAYWVMILLGALAAVQFAFLVRRNPIGTIRKVALWGSIIGVLMQVAASIRFDLYNNGSLNIMYYAGIVFVAIAVVVTLVAGIQTRPQNGMAFVILTVAFVAVGLIGALVAYNEHLAEIVVAFSSIAAVGPVLYSIYGADAPDRYLARFSTQAGARTPMMPTRK